MMRWRTGIARMGCGWSRGQAGRRALWMTNVGYRMGEGESGLSGYDNIADIRRGYDKR
jgi:hypothetical protein